MDNHLLYLDAPVASWDNASPVGCGGLGAMEYGGVKDDVLQLNEEHIWASARPYVPNSEFLAKINQMRELLLKGEPCDDYANENIKDSFGHVGSFETAGELCLHFSHGEYSNYARKLYTDKGFVQVTYESGGTAFTRTVFASHPKKMIVMHITADHPKKVSFTADYRRENIGEIRNERDMLAISSGTVCGQHTFTVKIKAICDGGALTVQSGEIHVEKADSATLLIKIATDREPIDPGMETYEKLLEEHIEDFSALFSRSDLSVLSDEKSDLPVPQRLARMKAGEKDPGLLALYFSFGKYLMISSSREDSLPANLQGVWCQDIHAIWESDYHTNINLQMNYWPTYVTNLAPCGKPLGDFLSNIVLPHAKKVAAELYHCHGAVLHHLTDAYGFAYPADGVFGLWPHGGGWLCRNLWEEYLFTENTDRLAENYDYLKQCALFYMEYMFEQEGQLLSGPSTSPENRYVKNGCQQNLCLSPTMDREIITDCLEIFIQASDILQTDGELREQARNTLKKIPGFSIGKRGQLMEWLEDYEEFEPGHRHISHAYGLYPGTQLNQKRPELLNAVKKTIELRLQNGGGHTGWSAAWLICLYARLADRAGVERMLTQLFTKSTLDNLFDTHPPFQIDGNFGATAGMAEALLQSHEGVISLLPAVPESLASGSFRGLVARGNIEVSANWENGKVLSFSLLSRKNKEVQVIANGNTRTISLTAGEELYLKL